MESLPSTHAVERPTSSVGSKMLNLLAAPGEVFDEVVAAPYAAINWRQPTLLVSAAAILLVLWMAPPSGGVAAGTATDPHLFAGAWPIVVATVTGAVAFGGTFWAAAILWCISRMFLRVRVPYWKAVEVAGLSGTIVLLGTIVTGLLITVSGDVHCRPSLGLLVGQVEDGKGGRLLELFNFFHLWAALVLAVGLSRLSAVSFKEASFWVFGFWIVVRLGLVLLV